MNKSVLSLVALAVMAAGYSLVMDTRLHGVPVQQLEARMVFGSACFGDSGAPNDNRIVCLPTGCSVALILPEIVEVISGHTRADTHCNAMEECTYKAVTTIPCNGA